MDIENLLRDDLWKAIQAHYEKEDYTEALRDAMFFICDLLRDRSGEADKDGTKLVENTLLGNNPLIQINKNETSSEKDIQQGVGFAIKGLIMSVRNPMSHEKKEYSAAESDAILLYTNYLINIIDKSGGHIIDNMMDLLVDEDFTDTKEYAELLLKEIPVKKRYDFAIELFQKRACLPRNRLRHFINLLLASLSKTAMKDFCRVVSKNLILCKDDNNLRLYIEYFMDATYQNIDKLAQLRIEQFIKHAINDGEYVNGTCTKGSLAGWIGDSHFDLLGNKKELRDLLFMKTEREGAQEKYVFAYFVGTLFPDDCEFSNYQERVIKQRLEAGDRYYIDLISAFIIFGDEKYRDIFEDSYNIGKNKMTQEI